MLVCQNAGQMRRTFKACLERLEYQISVTARLECNCQGLLPHSISTFLITENPLLKLPLLKFLQGKPSFVHVSGVVLIRNAC